VRAISDYIQIHLRETLPIDICSGWRNRGRLPAFYICIIYFGPFSIAMWNFQKVYIPTLIFKKVFSITVKSFFWQWLGTVWDDHGFKTWMVGVSKFWDGPEHLWLEHGVAILNQIWWFSYLAIQFYHARTRDVVLHKRLICGVPLVD
jgi:hypothetical protein